LIKIKIDECLPHECADLMIQQGYNVEAVRQEGLQGSADTEIWNAAQREERFQDRKISRSDPKPNLLK